MNEIKEPLPGKETASLSPIISTNAETSQGYATFNRAGKKLKKLSKKNNGKTANLSSAPISYRAEDRLIPILSATEIKTKNYPPIEFLPFLGEKGFIPKGWMILLAGYPKTGKTEIVFELAREWGKLELNTLYVSEESHRLWHERVKNKNEDDLQHIDIAQAIGADRDKIRELIEKTEADIVIIDTIRNLLGLENENDNSEIARVLSPFIEAANRNEKTLILLHHTKKGGGVNGEGITGGHAFSGIVDIALELLFHSNKSDNKRVIRGQGRIFPITSTVFALNNGCFEMIGSLDDLQLIKVKENILDSLSEEWIKTTEVRSLLNPNAPSRDLVSNALEELALEKKVDRDPDITEGKKPGVTYKWRISTNKEI